MVCPGWQRQLLRRVADVEGDQQPLLAGAPLVGEDVSRGSSEPSEQRDVADRERGMRAAEREQAAMEDECRTGRLRQPLDIALAPVVVQWKPGAPW